MNGGEKWLREAEELVIEQFRLITTTLLSLLLPLSFLLFSRLASAAFLFSLVSPSPPQNSVSYFLNTNHVLVYTIVSTITLYTLIHNLTTKLKTSTDTNRSISLYYPRVIISWLILLTFQFSLGLGLQETFSKRVNGIVNVYSKQSFFKQILFFFGLHEVMLQWCRLIVKPVVETGFSRRKDDSTVVEKVALSLSCGVLWWWKLRDEVEALVCNTMEIKKALLLLSINVDYLISNVVDLRTVDFLNFCFYYMIVTIGIIRIVKGCFRVAMILLFEQVTRNVDDDKV